MLKYGLLFLALASLCAADEEFPPEYSVCGEAGSCHERVAGAFKTASQWWLKAEPVSLNNIDPCDVCDISSLPTIGVCESKIVNICADKNDPEGMYYSVCLDFDEIKMTCVGCKVKDKQGVYQRGRYTAKWKNQEVAMRFMKEVWNGEQLKVLGFNVTSEPNPDLIDDVCNNPETDDWIKTCNETKKTSRLPFLFVTVGENYFSIIEEERRSALSRSLDIRSLSNMLTCNKDDID